MEKEETMENKKTELKEISKKKDSFVIPKGFIIGVIIGVVLLAGYLVFQTGEQSNMIIEDTSSNILPPDSAAAIVNGEEITVGELDAAYNSLPPEYKSSLDKISLLDQLVQTKIIYQEAVKRGEAVTNEEIKGEFEKAKELSGLTNEEIANNLATQGVSEGDLLERYAKQSTVQKFLDKNLISKIEVTDEEIETFYDENIDQFEKEEQVTVRHILIGDEDLDEIARKNKAIELLPTLTEDNFCDKVKEFSTDSGSVETCGEFTFGMSDPLVESFKAISFSQDEGKMGIVQTQFGSHIVWTVEKIPKKVVPLDEAYPIILDVIKNEKGKLEYANFYNEISKDSIVEIKYN